jgi:hypothetical protein
MTGGRVTFSVCSRRTTVLRDPLRLRPTMVFLSARGTEVDLVFNVSSSRRAPHAAFPPGQLRPEWPLGSSPCVLEEEGRWAGGV